MEDLKVFCGVLLRMLEQRSLDVRREDMMVGSKEGKEFDRRKVKRCFARKGAVVFDPFCVCIY